MESPSGADKRAFPRVSMVGSAIVSRDAVYIGTYLLENLSAGGALLAGDTKLSVGDRVQVMLELQFRARRFMLEAEVVRHARRGDQALFAIRFESLAAATQAAIKDAVLSELVRQPAGCVVLIIDPTPGHAMRLADDVKELGSTPVPLATALDAIAWLRTSKALIEAVIVESGADVVDVLPMLQLIAHDYPAVRRVLACADETAFRPSLESGGVHALLSKPWDLKSLARALGRPN
jgi:PilZ domain